jgi:hypothetical protein
MAAIITDNFRRSSTTFLLNDIKDQNGGADDSSNSGSYEYFIGIGKSDAWENDAAGLSETHQNFSTPLPTGTVIESKEVIDNLVGALAIDPSNAYHVIPRVNWAANRRYKRWNENDPTMFDVTTDGANTYYPCYAIAGAAGAEKIYICLDNNSNVQYTANGRYIPALSVQQPTGNSSPGESPELEGPRDAKLTDDGYIWAYVADLNIASEFNTDQFVSISETATGTATDATNSTGGMVYGFEIVDAGAGIDGDFKLVLNDNDGTANVLDLTVTLTGGVITGVTMTGGTTPSYFKSNTLGSVRASVVPSSGTTATTFPIIRPLVAPINGFGHTPTSDLPSFYAGLAVNYNGNVGGELPTSVSYRQISLLRNPTRFDDDAPSPTGDGVYADAEVYNSLRRFQFASSLPSGIQSGNIIVDASSAGLTTAPAKAFVDYVDETNKYVYFHQNESSSINQQEFTTANGTSSKISINGGTALTYNAITNPEYTPYSGEVYFLENRKPIQRAASQEEEIKLVIQF